MGSSGIEMTSSQFLIFSIASLVVGLISALVILDARDRGMNKVACIAWMLAVQIFFPVVLVYIFLRNTGIRTIAPAKKLQATVQMIEKKHNCPYCNAVYNEGAKFCKECGRLF